MAYSIETTLRGSKTSTHQVYEEKAEAMNQWDNACIAAIGGDRLILRDISVPCVLSEYNPLFLTGEHRE